MIIVGAKGLAKEVLEIVMRININNEIVFFDNTANAEANLFNQFPILHTEKEVLAYFDKFDNTFSLGLGGPKNRKQLYNYFLKLGGNFKSLISPSATIGHFDNHISEGVIIADGCIITNSITIKKGCLINLNVTIGHDTFIDEFVEICPGVNISGNVTIKKNSFIGSNATILPQITIGKNSIIGAGSVVTKNVPDNVMVAGNPAQVKKSLL